MGGVRRCKKVGAGKRLEKTDLARRRLKSRKGGQIRRVVVAPATHAAHCRAASGEPCPTGAACGGCGGDASGTR